MKQHVSEVTIAALLYRYGADIFCSEGMLSERSYMQHGNISCYEHSVAVAAMSIRIMYYFHVQVDVRSMVRGALLHDYFLYDWHVPCEDRKGLHGFTHAGCALRNAERDFELSGRERDIIEKHMFPMNPGLPRYKESVIVTLADKLCAARETFLHRSRPNRMAG